jgi:hypothetical protein
MVRRGSTVRVRQRALFGGRTARKWAVFVALVDTVEHLLIEEGVAGRETGDQFGQIA